MRQALCHCVPRGPSTDSSEESFSPQNAQHCIPPNRGRATIPFWSEIEVVEVRRGLPEAVDRADMREKIPAAGLAARLAVSLPAVVEAIMGERAVGATPAVGWERRVGPSAATLPVGMRSEFIDGAVLPLLFCKVLCCILLELPMVCSGRMDGRELGLRSRTDVADDGVELGFNSLWWVAWLPVLPSRVMANVLAGSRLLR